MTEKPAIPDKTDVIVVGTGFLGRQVAQMSRSGGAKVYATTRRRSRMESLDRSGFVPVQFDWTDRRTLRNLPWGDLSADARILVAVSYDRFSGLGRDEYLVGGLVNLLSETAKDARICYISTTGVYHQTDGSWVDERSTTRPNREAGRVHLRAEGVLHKMRPSQRWTILRLAGIYGHDRIPRAADVIAGRPVRSQPDGYLNLIHVTDASRAVLSAWDAMRRWPSESPTSMESRLVCVSDDRPVLRRDFYGEVARIADVPAPTFEAPDPTSAAAMRGMTNKRIWNRRLRRDLLTSLRFPDFRHGLADILSHPLE